MAGTWRVERKKAIATLRLAPFAALATPDAAALAAEGEALLRFLEPDAATFELSQESPGDAGRSRSRAAVGRWPSHTVETLNSAIV